MKPKILEIALPLNKLARILAEEAMSDDPYGVVRTAIDGLMKIAEIRGLERIDLDAGIEQRQFSKIIYVRERSGAIRVRVHIHENEIVVIAEEMLDENRFRDVYEWVSKIASKVEKYDYLGDLIFDRLSAQAIMAFKTNGVVMHGNRIAIPIDDNLLVVADLAFGEKPRATLVWLKIIAIRKRASQHTFS